MCLVLSHKSTHATLEVALFDHLYFERRGVGSLTQHGLTEWGHSVSAQSFRLYIPTVGHGFAHRIALSLCSISPFVDGAQSSRKEMGSLFRSMCLSIHLVWSRVLLLKTALFVRNGF